MPIPYLRVISRRDKKKPWVTTRYLGWITGKEFGRSYTMHGVTFRISYEGDGVSDVRVDSEKLLARVEWHAKRLGMDGA